MIQPSKSWRRKRERERGVWLRKGGTDRGREVGRKNKKWNEREGVWEKRREGGRKRARDRRARDKERRGEKERRKGEGRRVTAPFCMKPELPGGQGTPDRQLHPLHTHPLFSAKT